VRFVLFLRAKNLTGRREGCDRVSFDSRSGPHPLEKKLVASVKHCSILALAVLYFRLSREDGVCSLRRGAKERDVCHG